MERVFRMNDLITVIVPIYNVEKYLNRCVDSIINQTYTNLEIILVDDGSPDNCGKICDEYAKKDNRIKVIHKENGGLSDARNAGIKVADGKYIGFVDSDDWINPKMYEELYSTLLKYDADISCCKMLRCKDNKDTIQKEHETKIVEYNQEQYMKKFFKIGSQECVYYACNKLYKKEIIEKDQYPINLTSEDVVGTYKTLLKSQKIVEINQIYYYYYYNPESITLKGFSKKDLDLIKIWDMVIEITNKNNQKYLEMAKFNRYRVDYTLLMRMASKLSFKQINKRYKDEYIEMLKNLKKHKKILLKGKIPFSRKITIIFICYNYKMFVIILFLLKVLHRRKLD